MELDEHFHRIINNISLIKYYFRFERKDYLGIIIHFLECRQDGNGVDIFEVKHNL